MMTTTLTLPAQREQELDKWATCFIKRFPNWVDLRLRKGTYVVLGAGTSASFLKERSLFHLKRILLTQFFLQRKVEKSLKKSGEKIFVRIFLQKGLLCVAIAYVQKDKALTEQTIFEVASQKVAALRKVNTSFYQWESRDLPYSFCYLELEKMRGKDLLPKDARELKAYLQEKLHHRTLEPVIFWPYNHEEAFKQLLALSKEVSSPKDFPQVSLHFQKQTSCELEFFVYLARAEAILSPETTIAEEHFPLSTSLTTHLTHKVDGKIPVLLEAFSLLVPVERCRQEATINLLYAREYIAKLLEDVIGVFRDYNGGLFETQKNRFKELAKKFGEKIPHFSLFSEDLFYALNPVEVQVFLDDNLFEKLFEGFSSVLGDHVPFLSKPNPHVMIFKSQDPDKFAAHLKQAKDLQKQGKVTAYAEIKILSHHYFLVISAKKGGLSQLKRLGANFSNQKRMLSLVLQKGHIPSLHPFYLGKELRGHSIAKLIFEGLTRLDLNNRVEYAGCEKVEISNNKKRYVFKIRNHVWSNGENVTAFDYEKSWKYCFFQLGRINFFSFVKNSDAIRRGEKPIEQLGIKALDSDHLQVDLQQEDPFFLERLTYPMFFPCFDNLSEPNVFNGPYAVRKNHRDVILLEKNPYYWKKEGVSFDQIDIRFNRSSVKIYEDFVKGNTSWIGAPFNSDDLDTSLDLKVSLKRKKEACALLLFCNTKHFALALPVIRQALSSVIDRELITSKIYPNTEPLVSFFTNHLDLDDTSHHSKAVLKGKNLFEKGLQELGLSCKTFPPLTITFDDQCPKKRQLVTYLQATWEKAFNIKINLRKLPWNRVVQQVERGSFHITGFFKSVFTHSFFFFEEFSCPHTNYSQWSHSTYRKALIEVRRATSIAKKNAHLREARQLLTFHLPVIPLATRTYFYAHHPSLKDYIIDYDGGVDFSSASIDPLSSK